MFGNFGSGKLVFEIISSHHFSLSFTVPFVFSHQEAKKSAPLYILVNLVVKFFKNHFEGSDLLCFKEIVWKSKKIIALKATKGDSG